MSINSMYMWIHFKPKLMSVHPRQIIITNLKAFEDYVCFDLFMLFFSIFIEQESYKRKLVEMGLILIYSSNER